MNPLGAVLPALARQMPAEVRKGICALLEVAAGARDLGGDIPAELEVCAARAAELAGVRPELVAAVMHETRGWNSSLWDDGDLDRLAAVLAAFVRLEGTLPRAIDRFALTLPDPERAAARIGGLYALLSARQMDPPTVHSIRVLLDG